MMINIDVDILLIIIVVLWTITCLCIGIGLCLPKTMQLENILEYIRHDEDDAWYHKVDYEEMKDKKEILQGVNDELIKQNKNYKIKCEAYETQIECLKAEICELKNKIPQIKDRSD